MLMPQEATRTRPSSFLTARLSPTTFPKVTPDMENPDLGGNVFAIQLQSINPLLESGLHVVKMGS